MSRTRTQSQTTSYGANLTLRDDTTQVEVWFLDAGAHVAGTVKITAQDGASTPVEAVVAAGGTYYTPVPRGIGSDITLNLKAASGTPVAQILEM